MITICESFCLVVIAVFYCDFTFCPANRTTFIQTHNSTQNNTFASYFKQLWPQIQSTARVSFVFLLFSFFFFFFGLDTTLCLLTQFVLDCITSQ